MVSAWRNFKNIFPRPLFFIIFRPEMLKFHPYSILTGETRVELVIYCVLMKGLLEVEHQIKQLFTFIRDFSCITRAKDPVYFDKCTNEQFISDLNFVLSEGFSLCKPYFIIKQWKNINVLFLLSIPTYDDVLQVKVNQRLQVQP